MESRTVINNAFKEWSYSTYKRSVAIQLCQTLERVEFFLRETAILKGSFFDLKPDAMARCLGNLNRNRVFKFRNREAMPWLGKLSNALSAFVSSDIYGNAVQQFACSTGCATDNKKENEESDKVSSAGFAAEGEKQLSVSPAPSSEAVCSDTVQTADTSTVVQEELPAEKAVRNILEKCVIRLDGEVISKEAISQSFLSFLSEVSAQHEHNIGIVLHTGSIIFDALAVLWAAISSMLANETSPEDLVRSLRAGEDLVEYANYGRCRFEGIFEENGMIKALLIQNNQTRDSYHVPASLWSKITPYQGKATKLDGRGARSGKAKRKKFYTEVLNVKERDIPSVTDVSTVFIMPREKADMLVKGLSICHNDDVFELLELITASWYTEKEEYTYSGNAGKNEPVLKFTGSISTGRVQLLKRGGNRHAGLFVCDSDELRKGESELPELLNRKALQYVHILTDVDMEQGEKLVEDNETAEVFACTRDFLLSCPLQLQEKNPYTCAFSEQVDAILEHSTSYVQASGFIDWKTLQSFRRTLFNMKDSSYEAQSKNDFIIGAWSLINLFQTMPFPLSLLENMIQSGKLSVESPAKRISDLAEAALDFPSDLAISAQNIITVLNTCYQSLTAQEHAPAPDMVNPASGKCSKLIRLIKERADKRICVVVPKRYYETVMLEAGYAHLLNDPADLTITTANQFDRSRIFDCIIVVGDFRGKRFDCFRCSSAREVISVLYPCERNQYLSKRKQSLHADKIYNERSFVHVDTEASDAVVYEENATEAEVQQLEEISTEMDSFIERLTMTLPVVPGYAHGNGNGKGETEIVAAASFDTGEKAFFTPYYEACVFDEIRREISEKRIADKGLSEGDLVVFTRNDEGMHDIVDDIMQMLIKNGRLQEKEHIEYNKSLAWKRKLKMYMILSKISEKTVADIMKKNGISITPQTIKIWGDLDAHTVGPRNEECIRQIGRLVGDKNMEEHPEETMEACRTVRQRRRKILDVIEKSIRNKLCGKVSNSSDPIEQEIYSRIDSQADILKVEAFMPMKKTMLNAFVNRPISL